MAIAVLALAYVAAPTSSLAVGDRMGGGDLSSRLAELAKPSVRSAPPSEQAAKVGLPSHGPGSLLRDGKRVLVEVRFERGVAAAVDDLRAAGARVAGISRRYQVATVAAKPAELRRLSSVRGVANATEILAPLASASTCPSGTAVSEGDGQLRAAEARTSFGLDGAGVTVGVLSDSFDEATEAGDGSGPIETHEAEDVESGDLPGASNTCTGQATPVDVLEDFNDPEAADEGRGMAQIVHDLAPGAQLSFASAFTGLTTFADNIEALAAGGANVIVDDVSYFEEPFFQEGPVGVAVGNVTEDGVSYFSSAANNNLINDSRDIASWEAPEFRDSSGCPAAVVAFSQFFEEEEGFGLNPTHCMDFNPGLKTDRAFRITVSPGETLALDLQWAEPWNGVDTDLDAFLLSPKGALLTGSIEGNVSGSERPFEFIGWENNSGSAVNVQLAINRFSGGVPRLKFTLLQNGGGVTSTEYESSIGGDVVGPTIFGHNGAEDATSVGAIGFDTTEVPEEFSSRGPVTHFFDPVNGTTPADPLTPERVLSKPDVTATDCGATTFFAFLVSSENAWRFCGTSAAAPHAAAVAALMLEEDPSATPEEIRAALKESATLIGTFGACAVGSGLVDAVGAIERLLLPGSGTTPVCTAPISEPGEPEEDVEVVPPSGGGGGGAGGGGSSPAPLPPPPEPPVRLQLRTFFLKHPPKVIRTTQEKMRVAFRFGASESDVTFSCRADREPFHVCRARFARRFGIGAHVVRVKAGRADGSVDRTPAVYRFEVKRQR